MNNIYIYILYILIGVSLHHNQPNQNKVKWWTPWQTNMANEVAPMRHWQCTPWFDWRTQVYRLMFYCTITHDWHASLLSGFRVLEMSEYSTAREKDYSEAYNWCRSTICCYVCLSTVQGGFVVVKHGEPLSGCYMLDRACWRDQPPFRNMDRFVTRSMYSKHRLIQGCV